MARLNKDQETAEPRKMYGTSEGPDVANAGARGLHSVGDPEFSTSAQNGDEFYLTRSEVPDDLDYEDD